MGQETAEKIELDDIDIETLIPHSGGMCLLEKIISYSSEEMICQTTSHLSDKNPLKENGSLSKMHLIEYGAQAVAVHGGLIEKIFSSDAEPKLGYIAVLKSIKWGGGDFQTPLLEGKALLITENEASKLYEFEVRDAEQQSVCTGRVMVVHPQ